MGIDSVGEQMSKICILAIVPKLGRKSILKEQICDLLLSIGLGVSFSSNNYEPLIDHLRKTSIICFVADSTEHNNCELLLLPDNCFFNGMINEVPFKKRMGKIGAVITAVSSNSERIDLFFGYSGDRFEDYKTVLTTPDSFPSVSSRVYNNSDYCSIHFIFQIPTGDTNEIGSC